MTSARSDLRRSAVTGLIWGVGGLLARDIVQFVGMLVMVRILSPQMYGEAALAQTILAFVAVISLKTLSQFALQARDPMLFDWDAQFTAGAAINALAFLATVTIALFLLFFFVQQLTVTAHALLILSSTFILEIASIHYFTWLQANHRWKRLRIMVLAGSLISTGMGICLAYLGCGALALASMSPFFTLPFVLDFLIRREAPARFSLPLLKRYAQGVRFGANRAVSGGTAAARVLIEHAALSTFFGFAALGSYSRTVGLAQISSGRVGPIATEILYPVLTRADPSSARFRSFSALLFQGVTWFSVPTATFVAVESRPLVDLLYGSQWEGVGSLLPIVSALFVVRGLSATLNQILLANTQIRTTLGLELTGSALALAALPIALPLGVEVYVQSLVLCATITLCAAAHYAARGDAVTLDAMIGSTVSSMIAASIAVTPLIIHNAVWPVNSPNPSTVVLNVVIHGCLFGVIYLLALRFLAPTHTMSLLSALPLPTQARAAIAILLATGRR